MSKSRGTCFICGTYGKITDDHIPPRKLYPIDIQNRYNLITIYCCESCHKQFSKDDKYLKTLLTSLTDETVDHPVAIERRESVKRDLEDPKSRKFWAEIARSMVPVWRQSQGGIWIRRCRLNLNHDKLSALFSRFVRGLFYREQGYKKIMESDVHFALIVPDDYGSKEKGIIYQNLGYISSAPPTVKHDDVFEYRSQYFQDTVTLPHSIWHFRFYDAHDFFMIVYANEYKGPDGPQNLNS